MATRTALFFNRSTGLTTQLHTGDVLAVGDGIVSESGTLQVGPTDSVVAIGAAATEIDIGHDATDVFLFGTYTLKDTLIFDSLTPGSVLFLDGSSALAEDNTRFYWDDSAHRMGINTNTPASQLHVAQDAPTSGVEILAWDSTAVGSDPFAFIQAMAGLSGEYVLFLGVLPDSDSVSLASAAPAASGVGLSLAANDDIGHTFQLDLLPTGGLQGSEMAEPANGPANTGRLFFKDNGAGKTQLCVRFSSGASQVIATQP